jgi:protein-histidine N-methyltransferase
MENILDMSSASAAYRTSLPASASPDDEHPPADASTPSNLPLPLSLKSAFQASLREYNIHLRFFSGSWTGFDPRLTGGQYDLVFTSETIYRSDGQKPLIDLMRAACGYLPQPDGDLDELTQQKLSIRSDPSVTSRGPRPYLCLVAAKVLYFGVGGGVSEFARAVESSLGQGKMETVWEKKVGVGRRIRSRLPGNYWCCIVKLSTPF